MNFMKGKTGFNTFSSYCDLGELWENISENARKIITIQYGDVTNSKIASMGISKFKFLSNVVMWQGYYKEYEAVEQIIGYIEKNKIKPSNITELHFYLLNCINVYYKPSEPRIFDLDKVIQYCKMDIELLPAFKKEYLEQARENLINWSDSPLTIEKDKLEVQERLKNLKFNIGIPSFKYLALAYEKKEMYREAIEACKSAISNDIGDDTKSGFEGRIIRLNKKMNKNKITS